VKTIDLNCDLGESFGVYRLDISDEVLVCFSSANVACGFHAGDPTTMRRTVRRCLELGIAVGAHPGLPDLVGFGRRRMDVSAEEVYDIVVYQIGALRAFVESEGGRLRHVKPHGALYHMAAERPELAEAVAEAVRRVDASLVLYGLAGSRLIEAAEKAGLRAASEAFADRAYDRDGKLVPRGVPQAVLTETGAVVEQAVRLASEGRVRTAEGAEIVLRVDTICFHGDGPAVADGVRAVRRALAERGIGVAAP